MNRTHLIFISIALTSLISCGSKQPSPAPAEAVEAAPATEQPDELREALDRNDTKAVKSMANELALNADDLTPKQAVSVLMGFYDLHMQYGAEHKNKSDMETMRKFVDVYDIVRSNYGDEFTRALSATKEVYPDVDFQEIYRQFVERLSQYDGYTLSDTPAPADTVPSDSIPPELRPAE